MKNHKREPVEETCPIINGLILQMDLLKFRNNRLLKEEYSIDDLKSQIEENSFMLDDFKVVIEKLRNANKALRQWGLSEARRFDEISKS